MALPSALVLLASWAAGHAVGAAAAPPSWPSNPDGIVIKWENGKGPALASDPAGKPLDNCFLRTTGLAWLGLGHCMHIQNGAFTFEKGVENALSRLKAANRMSIEFTATTHYVEKVSYAGEPKKVVSFAAAMDSGNFLITQGGDELWGVGMLQMQLWTSFKGGQPTHAMADLCRLEKDKPKHVVVTYEPGRLVCYADGKKVRENASIKGDLSHWEMQPFFFGGGQQLVRNEHGNWQGRNSQFDVIPVWRGELDGFCLYDRVLSEGEVAGNYAARTARSAARRSPERLVVQGKLTAKSIVPSPEQSGAYRNALAFFEYDVQTVVSGKYATKKVRVAQWVLMDKKPLIQALAQIGRSAELTVEPFDEHPELTSELQSDTLPLAADLVRYVEVGMIDETPTDPALVAKQRKELDDWFKSKQGQAPPKPRMDLAKVPAEIEKLTGARTRIVWQRQIKSAEPKDKGGATVEGWFAQWQLMCLDTREGAERVLVPGPISCANPCITHDGARVLFCDTQSFKAYVINWDGTGRRLLSDDAAAYYTLYAWRDPATGIDWAYLGDHGSSKYKQDNCSGGGRIVRVQIDNPEVREPVWDGPNDIRFRVSADGKFAGGAFPFPNQNVVELATKKKLFGGRGCVGSMAPDNSHRFFHYDGSHRNLMMYDGDGSNPRKVPVTDGPEFSGMMCWGADWTNDVRFFTMSGPMYSQWCPGACDIYLGGFDETFTGLKNRVKVTDSPACDVSAYAWIEPKVNPQDVRPAQRDKPGAEAK